MIRPGDKRADLCHAALDQSPVRQDGAVFVFSGVPQRTTVKYGQRAVRYVYIEVGHAAQNLLLQAKAQALGSVVVGAFRDDEVSKVLGLPADTQPLTLMPVGR